MLTTLIPVKPFTETKTRLAPILSPQQRVQLSQRLLRHTILVGLELGPVWVISRSGEGLHIAQQLGAHTLPELGQGLNQAIQQGISTLQGQGCASLLVLPIDLPLVSKISLDNFVARARQSGADVTLAPCQNYLGTNALYLTLPSAFRPHFGLASFSRHQQIAQNLGLKAESYYHPSLAFDLDTPQDWHYLVSQTAQALQFDVLT